MIVRPPAPRHRAVWVDGYWTWNGRDYVWTEGHWERERHGHRWRQARWEDRHGTWVLVPGGWVRVD